MNNIRNAIMNIYNISTDNSFDVRMINNEFLIVFIKVYKNILGPTGYQTING